MDDGAYDEGETKEASMKRLQSEERPSVDALFGLLESPDWSMMPQLQDAKELYL